MFVNTWVWVLLGALITVGVVLLVIATVVLVRRRSKKKARKARQAAKRPSGAPVTQQPVAPAPGAQQAKAPEPHPVAMQEPMPAVPPQQMQEPTQFPDASGMPVGDVPNVHLGAMVGATVLHTGAIVQLGTTQLDLLQGLEAQAVNPDSLFLIFKARHCAARIRHEAELAQLTAGMALKDATSMPMSARQIALDAVEAADDYENVRMELHSDIGVAGYAVPALTNALVQVIDQATNAQKFGMVVLMLEANANEVRFIVKDHGADVPEAQLNSTLRTMQEASEGRPHHLQDDWSWSLGAALRGLDVEVSLASRPGGRETEIRVPQEAIVSLEEVEAAREAVTTFNAHGSFAQTVTQMPAVHPGMQPGMQPTPSLSVAAHPLPTPVAPLPLSSSSQAPYQPVLASSAPSEALPKPPLYLAALRRLDVRQSIATAERAENVRHLPRRAVNE